MKNCFKIILAALYIISIVSLLFGLILNREVLLWIGFAALLCVSVISLIILAKSKRKR